MQPEGAVPEWGPAVGPGNLCLLVTSKASSSISPYFSLSHEAWIWLATHEKGVNASLGTGIRLSRCKASVVLEDAEFYLCMTRDHSEVIPHLNSSETASHGVVLLLTSFLVT